MEKQIAKLKLRIDQARAMSSEGDDCDFSILINANLLAADTFLLESRLHNRDGHRSKTLHSFRMAELRLAIASCHLKNSSQSSQPSDNATERKFVGALPELIDKLGDGLISFKAIVEYKNISLTPALSRCFVDCVRLREDALAEFLANRPVTAKKSAQAALLLLEYVRQVSADEQVGQCFVARDVVEGKFSNDTAAIRRLLEKLRALRRQLSSIQNSFEPKLSAVLAERSADAEDALVDLIWAFARNDRVGVEQALLVTHFRIGSIEHALVKRMHSLDTAGASEVDFGDIVSGSPVSNMSPAAFERHTCMFFHAVKQRVSDQSLGAVAVSIVQNYKYLYEFYSLVEERPNNTKRIRNFGAFCRADLKKLRLLFSKAKIL